MRLFFHGVLYDDRCQRRQRLVSALFAAVMVCAPSPLVAGGTQDGKSVFVPNSALIYRGVYVEPKIVNGTSGYLIEIRDRSVTVNGVVVFDASNDPHQSSNITHPDVPVAHPLEEAERQFWNRSMYDEKRGQIKVDGRTYSVGDEFDFVLRGRDLIAHIRLIPRAMWLRVGTDSMLSMALKRPAIIDPEEERKKALRIALFNLRNLLISGHVMVMGESSTRYFDISELAAIRKSLAAARKALVGRAPGDIPRREALRVPEDVCQLD